MYVCICNALNDQQIDRALADGVRSTASVYVYNGCRPQCGKCVRAIRAKVRNAVSNDALPLLAAE